MLITTGETRGTASSTMELRRSSISATAKSSGRLSPDSPEKKTPAPKNADIHMLRKALGITPNWFYIIVECSVQA
jgi:hypothetical protein